MGLRFVNRLGLAAGVDRNGAALAQHAASGAGHVEIGTVTDARQLELSRRAGSKHLVVGINFASARQGIDSDVIEDYGRLLRSLWSRADYLVANFSAPTAGRGVETSGIEFLIDHLSVTCRDAARETGLIRPLLLKIRAGVCGAPVPSGIAAARDCGIDGLVLVTSFAERIIECNAEIGGMAVISVGSIATARDAKARLEAGAVLFQIYSSYVAGGAKAVRTIVDSTLEVEPSM